MMIGSGAGWRKGLLLRKAAGLCHDVDKTVDKRLIDGAVAPQAHDGRQSRGLPFVKPVQGFRRAPETLGKLSVGDQSSAHDFASFSLMTRTRHDMKEEIGARFQEISGI
jgi:hypothetical protein